MVHIHSGTPPSHRKSGITPVTETGPECRAQRGAAGRGGDRARGAPKGGLWKETTRTKQETQRRADPGDELRLRGAGRGEGRVRELAMHGHTRLSLRWVTNKHLLHGTRSSAQG